MPPPAKIDVCIIVFDLKAEDRENSLNTLLQILMFKQLSNTKDVVQLYLVNADKSSNELQHKGIILLSALTDISILIKEISNMKIGQSDWLEALDVAVEAARDWATKPGLITLQVVFITDLRSFERPNNGTLLNKLIENINECDIFLYVIGLDVEPPNMIKTPADVEIWMKNWEVTKDRPSNEKILRKVVTKTSHSVVCSYQLGIHLFQSYKYDKGMQPWNVPLTFGTSLSFNVSTLRITKQEDPYHLRKVRSNTENEVDAGTATNSGCRGVVFHDEFVQLGDPKRFKTEGPRSFQAIAFCSADDVPEYYFHSDCSYLVVPMQTAGSGMVEMFDALVEEMENRHVYLLAKRRYNKDNNPTFNVLVPYNCYGRKTLLMCALPYAQDVNIDYMEQALKGAPVTEIDENVRTFLESIDITKCGLKVPPLAPSMMLPEAVFKIQDMVMVLQGHRKCTKLEPFTGKSNSKYVDTLKEKWPRREVSGKAEIKNGSEELATKSEGSSDESFSFD